MSDEKTYEGEMCEGCALFRMSGSACYGWLKEPGEGPALVHNHSQSCRKFARSLQCRSVLALERQADALEKLTRVPPFIILPVAGWDQDSAEQMAQAIRCAMVQAQDMEGDPEGP